MTHVEGGIDFAVGRVFEEDFLKGEDRGDESLGARGELVGLAVLHRAEVVVADHILEDAVKAIQRCDPVLQVRPRPRPALGRNGLEESGQVILLGAVELHDELGDREARRRAPFGGPLDLPHPVREAKERRSRRR